jgi:GH24 family phage-related lysozyme (muramidase)
MPLAPLTPRARDLILSFEGLDQPSEWPGGDSGITIGIGYDLGYATSSQFRSDWSADLDAASVALLVRQIGLKGAAASAVASTLKSIRIDRDVAERVFMERTVPNYQAQLLKVYPGVDKLPADAQGALLSLIYNRGTSLTGSRRTEMLAIRGLVASGDLQGIADEIVAMKRLWVGQGMDGLLKRRDAEAQLVESCIIKPGPIEADSVEDASADD